MDMGAAYHGRYMKKNQPVLISGLTHALVHGLHNALTTGVVHSTAPPLTHAPAGGKSRLLCSPTACTRHRHELLWGLEGRSKATGVDAHLAFFSATTQARALYEPDVVAHALLLLHLLLLLPRLLPLLPALGVVQPGASAPPAAQASLGDMPPSPTWLLTVMSPPTLSSWYAGPPQLLERTVQGGAQRRPFPECRPGRGRAHQPDHRVAPCRVSDLVARALRACLRAASYERDETDFSTRQPQINL